jgi:hypothetical protein
MFDPAFRYELSHIREQASNILNSEYFSALLEEIPNVILIINNARQVVYANRAFISQLEFENGEDVWGKRPGECLDCVRSTITELGCGSTPYCKVCGFANAISNSEAGNNTFGECNIVVRGGETLSYSVFTRPFFFNDQPHVFCYLQDISDKRTHEYLEHAFLHDIQNSVSVLYAMHDILEDLTPDEIRSTIKDLSSKLNEEVTAYRLISSAENNSLRVRPESIDITALVSRTKDELLNIRPFRNRMITMDSNAGEFNTDKTLFRRIILNLIKNALEASTEDDPIEITIQQDNNSRNCAIKVKSMPVIPLETQLQMFQKSFSTKGKGRGWGTYSIRLLTENYLKGKVSFVSNEMERTIFTISLPELKITG